MEDKTKKHFTFGSERKVELLNNIKTSKRKGRPPILEKVRKNKIVKCNISEVEYTSLYSVYEKEGKILGMTFETWFRYRILKDIAKL